MVAVLSGGELKREEVFSCNVYKENKQQLIGYRDVLRTTLQNFTRKANIWYKDNILLQESTTLKDGTVNEFEYRILSNGYGDVS